MCLTKIYLLLFPLISFQYNVHIPYCLCFILFVVNLHYNCTLCEYWAPSDPSTEWPFNELIREPIGSITCGSRCLLMCFSRKWRLRTELTDGRSRGLTCVFKRVRTMKVKVNHQEQHREQWLFIQINKNTHQQVTECRFPTVSRYTTP